MTAMIEQPIGKREANKQDRRQAIVEAARRSFLEEGYAATSMSGLLKTLGGSKATLWSYFRSKEELFAAVIEDVTSAFREELEGGLREAEDIEVTLVTFFKRFMTKTTQSDSIAAWRLIVGESGRFPELGKIFHEKAALQIEQSLSTYLKMQIAAGRLRDDNSGEMAKVLVSFCTNRQNERIWGAREACEMDIASDARRFTGYFLRLFGTAE